MKNNKRFEPKFSNAEHLFYVCIIAFLLCSVGIIYFDSSDGESQSFYYYVKTDSVYDVQQDLTRANSATIGPFVVPDNWRTYKIQVSTRIFLDDWQFVELEVLDSDFNYQYSLGYDLWYQRGIDSEGHWVENRSRDHREIVFMHKGNYYFNIELQSNRQQHADVRVDFLPKKGSDIPFYILASLTAVLGFCYHMVAESRKQSRFSYEPITNRPTQGLSLFFVILFVMILPWSARGYGYMGYWGNQVKQSRFHSSTVDVNYYRDSRAGSLGARNPLGGGPGRGK